MLITVIRRNWQPIPKVLFALVVCLTAPAASATLCDAYFPFDRSLADASGNGYDGELIDGFTKHKSDNASQGRLACYRKS